MIAFSLEAKNCIRSGMDTSVYHACEMHTKKGKLRVRDRIDEIPHQIPAFGLQLIIFTSEGDNASRGIRSGQFCDAITVQTCTIDDAAPCQRFLGCLQHRLPAPSVNGLSFTQPELSAILFDQFRELRTNIGKVNDSSGWNMEAGQTLYMRLEFVHLRGNQSPHSQSVSNCSLEKLLQKRNFLLVRRDNDLSADFVADSMFAETPPSRDCPRGTISPLDCLACNKCLSG